MLWVVMYVLFVDICATFLLQELSLKYKQMTYRYFYFACNGHSIISSILLVIHSKTSAGTVAIYLPVQGYFVKVKLTFLFFL